MKEQSPVVKVKHTHAKTILRLPDLDIAKAAVINSLSCPDAQQELSIMRSTNSLIGTARTAVIVQQDCGGPVSRCVWKRDNLHQNFDQPAPRCGAPQLAYEAADCGLLSRDLAAGIRRVKGFKEAGCQAGAAG